jgi:hypothetical protein
MNTQNSTSLEIFKDIFDIFEIPILTEEDLFNVIIDFDTLKHPDTITRLYNLIPKYKEKYHTNLLTCLHKNSTDKQKLPAINFIRQILKCNKYKLKGYYISQGYDKSNGKKRLKRLYKIIRLE